MLHQFNITARKFNMLISPKKTRCMVTTANLLRCKLELEGQIIEQVMEFKNLSITLFSLGKLETDVEDQVIRANRATGCLNQTIWRNKNIGKYTKDRIYKTNIRPIMTYAAETRPDAERTKRMLEIAEMKTLKKIDGKTLWDRARSTDMQRR
ncbi:unnamed protein product [Diabrotica balteata]|uniref:Uncharacterized protein n=1 Tax=Diabrotica balteata TaxID=107213 RepID=A0A9N9X826_DIABA|nr:unnamed protein product [Diabrotica balteata]